MQKRENDHFIGLWRHKGGGWEIKYQRNGKKISEYRKDENEARLRAEYWKATLEFPQEQDENEHPVFYWERMLRKIAEMALNNPGDKDISATCRALAAAATAALRTAKYIPTPVQSTPDGAPITGDMSNLSTKEMESILGTDKAS